VTELILEYKLITGLGGDAIEGSATSIIEFNKYTKDFDDAFGELSGSLSKTINSSTSTAKQVAIASKQVKALLAFKAVMKGLGGLGTAINIADFKGASDEFFSEAETGVISADSASNLLEKAISFHPVTAGLMTIKNTTFDSLVVLNGINSNYVNILRNESTSFASAVNSFAENSIFSPDGNIEMYEGGRVNRLRRLQILKYEISQNMMFPSDREKLNSYLDNLIDTVDNFSYIEEFNSVSDLWIIAATVNEGSSNLAIEVNNVEEDEFIVMSGEEGSAEIVPLEATNDGSSGGIDSKNNERMAILDEMNSQNEAFNLAETGKFSAEEENTRIKQSIVSLEAKLNNAKAELSLLLSSGTGSQEVNTSELNAKVGRLNDFRDAIVTLRNLFLAGNWNIEETPDSLRKRLEAAASFFGLPYKEFALSIKNGSSYLLKLRYLDERLSNYKQVLAGGGNSADELRIAELESLIRSLREQLVGMKASLAISEDLLAQANLAFELAQSSLKLLLERHANILFEMNALTNDLNDDSKRALSGGSSSSSFTAEEWEGVHSFAIGGIGQPFGFGFAETSNDGADAIVTGQDVTLDLEDLSKSVTTGTGDNFGDYSYTALGQWTDASNTYVGAGAPGPTLGFGHWVVGATNSGEIPKQGSAIYSGELRGSFVVGNAVSNLLSGNISINANFASQLVSGSMAASCNGLSCATGAFSNLSMDSGDGSWGGSMNMIGAGAGASGAINGGFFGPQAAETGGSFRIDQPNGTVKKISGVFRAKQ